MDESLALRATLCERNATLSSHCSECHLEKDYCAFFFAMRYSLQTLAWIQLGLSHRSFCELLEPFFLIGDEV